MGGQKGDNVISLTESAVLWGVRQVMGLAASGLFSHVLGRPLPLPRSLSPLPLSPSLPAQHGR